MFKADLIYWHCLRNSLCCKVKGCHYDFWHKLDFFNLRDMPSFSLSRSHSCAYTPHSALQEGKRSSVYPGLQHTECPENKALQFLLSQQVHSVLPKISDPSCRPVLVTHLLVDKGEIPERRSHYKLVINASIDMTNTIASSTPHNEPQASRTQVTNSLKVKD